MDKNIKPMLQEGKILLADGATGTMLMAAGLPVGTPPELWNTNAPSKILNLHRSYLDAGSQIILTNTFGGSPIKLGKSGNQAIARELNFTAAQLARQSADGKAFVAGDIGPTGELMAPMGPLTFEAAYGTFAEQATALVEGGVDLIWIETMSDLEEAKAAVSAVKEVTDLPVFCSMSFGKRARTIMGVSPRQAVEQLWPLGLSAFGANCGEGLDMIPDVLNQIREAVPQAVLIVKPNAGLPRIVQGASVYDVEPPEFAARMRGFIELGGQVIGACCGSSPEYIAALSKLVNSLQA